MKTATDTAEDRRIATLVRIFRAAALAGDDQLRHAASLELARHGIAAEAEIRIEPPSQGVQHA